jgi:hypothetical protein
MIIGMATNLKIKTNNKAESMRPYRNALSEKV